jgi:cobalt-zinc-cadmium resistance protein CzcA
MNAVVTFSLKHRVLMVVLFVMMLAGGIIAFRALNIEAYPDPTPPMVDVTTQSPGLSAEEMERYITIPIETQTAGLPKLTSIRTISLYGLSDVKLQFSFDFTYEQALQQVLNRLAQMPPLSNGAQPQISPVSPIGEIFRYRLVGPLGYSVLDLKTLQDWVLQRRFRAVPGVIDVIGWGGKTKTFELQVDFNKLIAYGLTLPQLLQAIGNSNINVGGNTVNIGAQSAVVRGVGLIRSIDDLRNTMVTQSGGNPDGDGRAEAAARHRWQGRRRRHRAGHRADAPRRAEHAHDQARRAGGRAHQRLERPAARGTHRAHL